MLFIDEAYRLGEGHFAQEAVNELVDNMTKTKFAQNMVIILAGYDEDMNRLLKVNQGLGSRFADEFVFPPLDAANCLQLLARKLEQSNIFITGLQDRAICQEFLLTLTELSNLPAWGNARDVQTLAKSMVRAVFLNTTEKAEHLALSSTLALKCIDEMLSNRKARQLTDHKPQLSLRDDTMAQNPFQAPTAPIFKTSTVAATQHDQKEPEIQQKVATQQSDDPRDDGVSDAIWEQLQKDKKLAEIAEHQYEEYQRQQKKKEELAKKAEEEAAALAAALREKQARDEAELNELLRKREEARIREVELRAERARIQKEMERKAMEEMERRKKEQVVQQKLRDLGVCCAGFRWIKQSGGYRCAGGSHFVDDSQLGI